MTDKPARPLALITGASSGIGAAFARELARRSHDLVLVARDGARLGAMARELEGQGAKCEVLVANLVEPAALRKVEARLAASPPIDLLVNNAGFGSGDAFVLNDIEREEEMIRLHVIASVRLAHAALPGMLSRKGGGLVNVSSFAAFAPMPLGATYAATKAYLNSFSESLAAEVSAHGVHVQALCPGFTHTELHSRAHLPKAGIPGFLWMQPEAIVRASLDSLGRKVICVPGLRYRALALLIRLSPRPLVREVIRRSAQARVARRVAKAIAAHTPQRQ